MRTFAALVFVLLAGCASRRPAFVVEMNDRRLEFETFREGRVPLGVEVLRMGPAGIRVAGDRPIEVNGVTVLARGEDVTIGGQKLTARRDARILVREDGEVEVRLSVKANAPADDAALRAAPAAAP